MRILQRTVCSIAAPFLALACAAQMPTSQVQILGTINGDPLHVRLPSRQSLAQLARVEAAASGRSPTVLSEEQFASREQDALCNSLRGEVGGYLANIQKHRFGISVSE